MFLDSPGLPDILAAIVDTTSNGRWNHESTSDVGRRTRWWQIPRVLRWVNRCACGWRYRGRRFPTDQTGSQDTPAGNGSLRHPSSVRRHGSIPWQTACPAIMRIWGSSRLS